MSGLVARTFTQRAILPALRRQVFCWRVASSCEVTALLAPSSLQNGPATTTYTLPVGVCIENVLNLPGLASVFPVTQLQQMPFASLDCCLSFRSLAPPHCVWWLSRHLQGCFPQHIFLTNTANFGKCRCYRSLGYLDVLSLRRHWTSQFIDIL